MYHLTSKKVYNSNKYSYFLNNYILIRCYSVINFMVTP